MIRMLALFSVYIVAMGLGWQALIWVFDIPFFILPSPVSVIQKLIEQPELFWRHGRITALEIILSLLFGMVLGFAAGTLIWWSRRLERNVLPLLIMTQALPVFAIAPILVTWLGYGMAPKLVMATLIVFFPVTLSTLNGLKRVPAIWIEQTVVMKAIPSRRFFWVYLPAALGTIAVGLRLAAVSAPIGAVVGEWVGASEGLGFLMLRANQRIEIDTVFAALIVLFVLTISIYGLVHWITGRALFWSPEEGQ